MKRWLLVLLLAVPLAGASANQYAVFQPADVEGQWGLGESVRVCAVEPPTGQAVLTLPDATTENIVPDSEACFSLTLSQNGAYTLAWPVAGPATRTVAFSASGVDWAWLVELVLVVGILVACFVMGWWFMAAFPLAIFPHLLFPAWPFDLKWALPFLFLGIILEWVSQRWKLRRGQTPKVM